MVMGIRKCRYLLLGVLSAGVMGFGGRTSALGGVWDEPWSVSEQAPAMGGVSTAGRPVEGTLPGEMGRACAYTWLRFYQEYLSVVVTSHCPMYPSCSRYSMEAIRRYGSFKGIILTADRLIHESSEAKSAPVIQLGPRPFCYDPVEANVKE